MRILTHNIHSGYDAELAKTGHDFHVLGASKAWDPEVRAVPENWTFIERPEGPYDCILLNHDWAMFEKVKDLDAPMIFGIIADCSEGVFPPEIEDRCSAVVFLAPEVADRWEMKDSSKKCVIEMGVDEAPFLGHVGNTETVLTVGHRIGKRWDKGHCPYVTVHPFIPLTLVGPGNEGLPGAVGSVPQAKLLEFYAHSRVYFNPGPIVGISVAEAMMAGLPIVTFRPINLIDVIEDGVHGYVVDTVDGAVLKLRRLLENPGLAFSMGERARERAREVFSSERFVRRWNALFDRVAGFPS